AGRTAGDAGPCRGGGAEAGGHVAADGVKLRVAPAKERAPRRRAGPRRGTAPTPHVGPDSGSRTLVWRGLWTPPHSVARRGGHRPRCRGELDPTPTVQPLWSPSPRPHERGWWAPRRSVGPHQGDAGAPPRFIRDSRSTRR